ncbi:MAG: hypothetical protein R3F05_19100 [Planctomycetota bacterium]
MAGRGRWTLLFVGGLALLAALVLVLRADPDPSGSLPEGRGDPASGHAEASLTGSRPSLEAPPTSAPASVPEPQSVTIPVEIHVFDAERSPVPANVHVETDTTVRIQEAPDGKTTFDVEITAPLTIRVRAEAIDRNAWSKVVTHRLSPGETHGIDLRIDGPRFTGRILDAKSGQPVARAEVRAYDRDAVRRRPRDSDTQSKEDGVFDLHLGPRAPAPSQYLYISHADYEPVRVPLPDSAESIEVQLVPLLRFAGEVVYEDGRPVVGEKLYILVSSTMGEIERDGYSDLVASSRKAWEAGPRREPFEDGEYVNHTTATTNEHGEFSIPLKFPGRARGHVAVSGYLARSFDVDTAVDRRPARIVLTRSMTPAARIRVVRNGSDTPLGRTKVWIQEGSDEPSPPTILVATTDEEGWFDASSLREGDTVRITLTPDPDDKASSQLPAVRPITWVVRHDATITVSS